MSHALRKAILHMNRFHFPVLGTWSPTVLLLLWGVLGITSPALAWKPITHIYLAEEAREELLRQHGSLTVNEVDFFGRKTLGNLGTFAVSPEVYHALREYPAYFRAGVLGPDAYPDMLFGQQTIHPETNHEGGTDAWLQHLASQVRTPAQRAFYLGFLSHAAGDMFAHTFVNSYAGGPFTLDPVENALRHIVVEGYLGDHTPALRSRESYSIETSEIDDFIYTTFIDARRPRNGDLSNPNLPADQLAQIRIWQLTQETFKSSLPGVFTRLRAGLQDLKEGYSNQKTWLRQQLQYYRDRCHVLKNPVACIKEGYYRVLLEFHETVVRLAVRYIERWEWHIDRGLRAWPATSTRVAKALFMQTDRHMDLGAAEQALIQYRNDYLCPMLGSPGALCHILREGAKVIQAVTGRLDFLKAIEERIFEIVITEATGHSPEYWRALAEAKAMDVDLHLPATPSTSSGLNALMHVSGNPPVFSLDRFAAAYNTTLATKLSMLDTREQWRSVLGAAGWLPPDPMQMMASHAFNGQLLHGFIRSIDADNQWLSPARMFLAEDCGLFSRFFMQQTGDYWENPGRRPGMEEQCPELVSLEPGASQLQCGGVDLQVGLSRPTGSIGGVLKLEGHLASGAAISGTPNHVWIAPATTLASVRFAEGLQNQSTVLTAIGTRVGQRSQSASTTTGCAADQLCSNFQCVSPPIILSTSQSASTAPAGGTVAFRATARDPQQSALTFAWAASPGDIVTQTAASGESEAVWRAPSCAPVGTTPTITVTVRNAHGLTTSRTFSVLITSSAVTSCWSFTGSMVMPRRFHTATLLPSGKVLVAGGEAGSMSFASAELYDPASGTWSPTGSMVTPRRFHTATLLPSGKVLVVGGKGASAQALSSAELYDPATGTWSPTGSMAAPHSFHTATLLSSGKVLVSGGGDLGEELYDPTAGTWSPAGRMASFRTLHTATLLPSGKVLVSGGLSEDFETVNTAELYDPATGTWSPTGSMNSARYYQTATLLLSGQVLVAGGVAGDGSITSSAELYDPETGTWSRTGSMDSSRTQHTATLLPSGKVLVTGGPGPDLHATTELYDPAMGRWFLLGNMSNARQGHTATLLRSGSVLVTGGLRPTAELYTP
jgi:hypothetical protein